MLCDLARQEIDALRADGVTVSDDDVVRLNDQARVVENAGDGPDLARGIPVRCGNVWLWPFTIQAQLWWRWAYDRPIGAGRHVTLAYALAYARAPGAFAHLYDFDAAQRAVLAWTRAAAFREQELTAALARVLELNSPAPPEPEDEDAKPFDYEKLSASLAVQTGLTRDEIEVMPLSYLTRMVDAMAAQADADPRPYEMGTAYIAAMKGFARLSMEIKSLGAACP